MGIGHCPAFTPNSVIATAAGEAGNASTIGVCFRTALRMFSSNGTVATNSRATSRKRPVTLDSLLKWAPFTPSFINRAEDQAFGISTIQENEYLSHSHGKDLIMRHDKHAFATKSIELSKFGKEIGDLERILLFSYYAKEHQLGYDKLKHRLWPFTSSFMSKNPELLTGLIFLIDGCFNGGDYVNSGSKRLMDTHIFCKTKLNSQLQNEKLFWRELVERLKQFKDYNNDLKKVLTLNKI